MLKYEDLPQLTEEYLKGIWKIIMDKLVLGDQRKSYLSEPFLCRDGRYRKRVSWYTHAIYCNEEILIKLECWTDNPKLLAKDTNKLGAIPVPFINSPTFEWPRAYEGVDGNAVFVVDANDLDIDILDDWKNESKDETSPIINQRLQKEA